MLKRTKDLALIILNSILKPKHFVLLTFFMWSVNLYAQWIEKSNGFDGADVKSLISNGTDLFLGTTNGVYRSTNNGANWIPVNTGMVNSYVYALTVSGGNLFAGTLGGGVFLSTDNGTSWTSVNTGLTNLSVTSFTVSGGNLFAGTGGGVFLSTNNGTSWTAVNTGLINLFIASLTMSGGNLFAGTNGGGVFLSTNNGTSWTAVNTGLTNPTVYSLTVSGANLFAGTFGGGAFLSTNNGTSWTPVNTGLSNLSVYTLAVNGGNLFAGTAGGGVFLSTNNGTSWTAINTGLSSPYVSALAVSGGNLFAGTLGSVFLSTNNGTSWITVNTGLTNAAASVLITSGGSLFAGSFSGVYLSNNNGTTWTAVNSGLTNTVVYALTMSGGNLFAGTDGDGVFLSIDNGTNWTAVNSGLTNTRIRTLTMSGGNLFAGTFGGGVFLSTNNGTNWTVVNSGLTNTTVYSFTANGGNLYAGTFGGVFLSTTNGTSWAAVNSGLTNTNVRSLKVSGSNLFAGTNGGGIFLSSNNGTSWTAVNTGLTSTSVYALEAIGSNLLAGTVGGVFLSTTNGATWTNVSTGLSKTYALSLAEIGGNLFAGIYGRATWTRPLSELGITTNPTITSFAPASGPIGTTVNIMGTNFNATPANNIVYFGATRANVSAASATQLTVTVPPGATSIAPITVQDITTGLQASSLTTIVGSGVTKIRQFTVTTTIPFTPSYGASSTYTVGNAPSKIVTGDFDGINGVDIATANFFDNNVTILLNNGNGAFTLGTSVNVGTNPYGIAVADFNGDGKRDLAVEHSNGGVNIAVSIRLGNGNGTFYSPATPEVPSGISNYANGGEIVAGDFNGDGKMDFATHDYGPGSLVSIRLGDGLGGFSSAANVSAGANTYPYSLAVGDFNGDGKADLATANIVAASVSIRLGDGNGAFTGSTSIPVGLGPDHIQIGDFNGDGKLDFATSDVNDRTISIKLGDGSGNFSSGALLAVVDAHSRLVLGDFNGDGKTDIVTINITLSSLRMFLGDGSGGATAGPDISSGASSGDMTVGDFNGDGKADLAVLIGGNIVKVFLLAPIIPTITSFSPTSGTIGTTVTITGTNFSSTPANNIVYFGATRAAVTVATATQLTVTVPTGATYQPISVQVNGLTAYSQKPFLVTFGTGGTVNTCAFNPRVDFGVGAQPYEIALGDLDGDGKADMVVTNYNSKTISVFRNISSPGSISTGSFAPKVDFIATTGTAYTQGVALGDIDGDGKLDIVVTNYIDNSGTATVAIFRNTAVAGSITSGSFATRVDFTCPGAFFLAIRDLDGDGKPEIAVTTYFNSAIAVFRNVSTPGIIDATSLSPQVNFPTTLIYSYSIAIDDIDGDGKPDLIATNINDNTVSVLRNTSTQGVINATSFAVRIEFTTGVIPHFVTTGDLDNDQKPELVVSNYGGSSISIFKNVSTAGTITLSSLSPKVDFVTAANPQHIAITDFDGDGKPDLAVANSTPLVAVYKNTTVSGAISSGSFSLGSSFTTGFNPYGVAAGDLDGDGKPDLITANFGSNSVSIIRNAVLEVPLPTITSFNPSAAVVGATVNILGTNFSTTPSNNIVAFNGTPAIVTVSTATSITTSVPVGSTSGTITVTVGCNTATSAGSFTVGSSCIPLAERNALIALYNSTAGASWTNKSNWLSADESTWFGVTVTSCHVTEIALDNNNLVGILPAVLDNLPSLTNLSLAQNKLSGIVPTSLGNLPSLIYLQLWSNQLTGSIPVELGSITTLITMNLSDNKLSGNIPSQFGNLINLQFLEIWGNLLTGNIPSQLGNIPTLAFLRLSSNLLTGSIPSSLGSLSNLFLLDLNQNQLSGSIPASLGNDTKLKYLVLNSNQLTGSIPIQLGNLILLEDLLLYSNQLSGNLPKELSTCIKLVRFSVGDNQLNGTLPKEYGTWTNLTDFGIYNNNFTGGVPTEYLAWTKIIRLYLSGNKLDAIPVFTAGTILEYNVFGNLLDFGDLEPAISVPGTFYYSPQADLPPGGTVDLFIGQTLSIPFSTQGSNNAYQWYNNGTPVPGATSANLNLLNVQIADEGSYVLHVTNSVVTGLTLSSQIFFVNISPPLISNKILYSKSDGTIWVTSGDGSADQFITNGYFPRLSPDGRYLLFHRGPQSQASQKNIYTRDLLTSVETLVFSNFDYAVCYYWSQDASKIIFDYVCSINSMNRDGSGVTSIQNFDCYDDAPTIRYSDGKIAFHNQGGIVMINGDGSSRQTIPNTQSGDYWPTWSPDGQWISFSRYNVAGTIFLAQFKIKPDGSALTQLTNLVGADLLAAPAAWANDGLSLFMTGNINCQPGIFQIIADGSNVIKRISDTFVGAIPDFVGTVVGTPPLSYLPLNNDPTITSFAPIVGAVGNTVVISGTNFSTSPTSNTVKFNGVSAVVSASTSTSLTVMVPVGATTGTISVLVTCSPATSAGVFTVGAPATITISTQPVDFVACVGDAATFSVAATGTTNITYQWQYSPDGIVPFADIINGGGYSNSTTSVLSINTTGSFGVGRYQCRINGDFANQVISFDEGLFINPLSTSPTGVGASKCPPSSLVLNASGGTNGQYKWYTVSTGGTAITGEVNSSYTTPVLTVSTTYYVTNSSSGCESLRIPVVATILTAGCTGPVIKVSPLTTRVEGKIIVDLIPLITTTGILDVNSIKIIIQPGSGALATIINGLLTIDYSGKGFSGIESITIEACTTNGVCSQQALSLEVADDVTVYNAVSPNGDKKNDYLYLQYIEILSSTKSNRVSIYNRWGDEVFSISDYDNNMRVFAGLTNDGSKLPAGTYFYKIVLPDAGKTLTGFIDLKY